MVTEDLRPLTTGQRFTLLMASVLQDMHTFGYSGQVADFAVCQAAHETGLFTSDLFLRANNAFGMRIANVRPQPWVIGVSNNYAVYATVRGSVCDYFDRQRAFGIPNTNDPDVYMDATVASGYATAGAYKQAWMSLLNKVRAEGFGPAFRLEGVPDGVDVSAPVVQASSGSGLLIAAALYAMSTARK